MKITLLPISKAIHADPGDWLIVRGREILGVVSEMELAYLKIDEPADTDPTDDFLVDLVERYPNQTTRQLCNRLGMRDDSARQRIGAQLWSLEKQRKIYVHGKGNRWRWASLNRKKSISEALDEHDLNVREAIQRQSNGVKPK